MVGRRGIKYFLFLAVLANLFFCAFHFVRFYGSRQGDGNLMKYLVDQSNNYDQVCLLISPGSPEDVIEINIWINKIHGLNKKICTLSQLSPGFYQGWDEVFDKEGIYYGEKVVLSSSTILAIKDYTGVTNQPLDKLYRFFPFTELNFTLPNIHPTRGFEIKQFNWEIGRVEFSSSSTIQ
jgi:hypothetical protein